MPDKGKNPRRRGRRYSEHEILAAIQRWASTYGRPPASGDWDPSRARRLGQHERVERYEDGNWPSTRVVRRAFGSFNAAIERAGLTPRPAPARIRSQRLGPEGVLEAIRAWTARYGEPPALADWDPYRARRDGQLWRVERYCAGDWPSTRTVCHHFGNFSNAVSAAGLTPRPRGQRRSFSEEQRLRNRDAVAAQCRASFHGPQPHLLARRVSEVAHARVARDSAALHSALIELASQALSWADHLSSRQEPVLEALVLS
jgi:hypothetical protein